MPRETNKIEVGERFERLLKKKLPAFDQRTYWVLGEDPPSAAVRDQELITFSFLGGHYDHPNQVGGLLDYQGTIRVKVWSTNYSDQHGEDRELLLAEPFGLYRVQGLLLLLFDDFLDDGNPLDSLLTEGIKVLSDETSHESVEDDMGNSFCGVLSVDFGVNFQWDLTADE
jgi:hypothetical protein